MRSQRAKGSVSADDIFFIYIEFKKIKLSYDCITLEFALVFWFC